MGNHLFKKFPAGSRGRNEWAGSIELCASCAASNPQALGKTVYIKVGRVRGETADRVVEMSLKDLSRKQIAATLGISERRVRQIMNPSKRKSRKPFVQEVSEEDDVERPFED